MSTTTVNENSFSTENLTRFLQNKETKIKSINQLIDNIESKTHYRDCFIRGFLWTALAVSILVLFIVFPEIKDSLLSAAKTTLKVGIELLLTAKNNPFSDIQTYFGLLALTVGTIGSLIILSVFLLPAVPLIGTIDEIDKFSITKEDLKTKLTKEQQELKDKIPDPNLIDLELTESFKTVNSLLETAFNKLSSSD